MPANIQTRVTMADTLPFTRAQVKPVETGSMVSPGEQMLAHGDNTVYFAGRGASVNREPRTFVQMTSGKAGSMVRPGEETPARGDDTVNFAQPLL